MFIVWHKAMVVPLPPLLSTSALSFHHAAEESCKPTLLFFTGLMRNADGWSFQDPPPPKKRVRFFTAAILCTCVHIDTTHENMHGDQAASQGQSCTFSDIPTALEGQRSLAQLCGTSQPVRHWAFKRIRGWRWRKISLILLLSEWKVHYFLEFPQLPLNPFPTNCCVVGLHFYVMVGLALLCRRQLFFPKKRSLDSSHYRKQYLNIFIFFWIYIHDGFFLKRLSQMLSYFSWQRNTGFLISKRMFRLCGLWFRIYQHQSYVTSILLFAMYYSYSALGVPGILQTSHWGDHLKATSGTLPHSSVWPVRTLRQRFLKTLSSRFWAPVLILLTKMTVTCWVQTHMYLPFTWY